MKTCDDMPRTSRRGFTLVEMLVVITIIAILAALVTGGLYMAMNKAKDTRIQLDISQLDTAVKGFKDKFGDYPPCDLRFDHTATMPTDPKYNVNLRRFVSRAFPRYNPHKTVIGDWEKLEDDLGHANTAVDIDNFDPARALVFWLTGITDDAEDPFGTNPTNPAAKVSRGEFMKTRLKPAPGKAANYLVYVPDGGRDVPYLYFDARAYVNDVPTQKVYFPMAATGSGYYTGTAGVGRPYALDVNGDRTLVLTGTNPDVWANPETFQIISAGQDGIYGPIVPSSSLAMYWMTPPPLYPAGVNYDTAGGENDNLTSFSPDGNLENAKPE